jgi:hypothetical protein
LAVGTDNMITGNIGDDVIADAGGDDTLRGNNGKISCRAMPAKTL